MTNATTVSIPHLDMTEQAMNAASRDWSVIPVRMVKGEKKPLVPWKERQQCPATAHEIRQWINTVQPTMWGVVTGAVSGLVILDFDGEQGRALMEEWGLQPHIRTGSGGYHVYVQQPGWHVKTFTSKALAPWNKRYPGLDIRGDGGYAVFSGRNASGPYEALREFTPDPLTVPTDEARAALGLFTAPEERPQPVTLVDIDPADRYPSERLLERALEMVEAGEGRDNSHSG